MSGGSLAIKIIEPGRIAPDRRHARRHDRRRPRGRLHLVGLCRRQGAGFQPVRHRAVRPRPRGHDLVDARGRRRAHPSRRLRQARRHRHSVRRAGRQGWRLVSRRSQHRLPTSRARGCATARSRATSSRGSAPPLVPLPPGEFFYQLQQGKVDGGEMSTPAMDAALGFDKLGLPYYMPGWQQPSAVLDFLMRKDKWEELPPAQRAQIETACRANIAWMLSRSPQPAGPGAREAARLGRRHQAVGARAARRLPRRTPTSC